MWFILIVIVAIVIISLNNSAKERKSNQEKNIPLIQETIMKLRTLEQYSLLPFMGEECGLVMIIPVNNEGDQYNRRSDRLKISLLLYTNDMNIISSYEPRTDIASYFHLVREDDTMSYISTTYSTLHGEYKAFMPQLNLAVREAFPNVEFEFDGSRVMT